MVSTAYKQFTKRWQEVTELPPQTVGPLTPYYKRVTKRLKTMPWPVFVVVSLAVVAVVFFLFGPSIISLVSLLQRGF